MQLRAILFDLWETLIHDTPDRNQPRRAWRSGAVCEVLARHSFDVRLDEVQTALDASTVTLTGQHDLGVDVPAHGRAYLLIEELETLTGRRAPESAVRELEDVITSMPMDMAPKLAPFAIETLQELRSMGMATALVCNAGFTTAPSLRKMLAYYGLSHLLDVLVFSDEMELAKPNPRVFQAALTGLGLEAAECAFVGDNPHTDISGAQGVGLFAVQVGNKMREGVTPSARIDGLHELVAALASHPGQASD